MFRNVKPIQFRHSNEQESQSQRPLPTASSFKKMNVGIGNNVLRVDERGLWMGSSDFSDAPFRIDMDGNFVLTASSTGSSLTLSASDTSILFSKDGINRFLIGERKV